jgi:putative oxidoreductase
VTDQIRGSDATLLLARALLSALFILSGIEKLFSYQATAAFMQANSIPAWFLPIVIFIEAIGGAAILLGFKTRTFAIFLAIFSLSAALVFHNQLDNKIHFILFWSDLAIAGGLLTLFTSGPGRLSVDHRIGRR